MFERQLLVTGGCGFIGTNFIKRVLEVKPGWHIINLDALTYAGNLQNLAREIESERYEFIKGDIRDATLLEGLIDSRRFNYVVHFAAESHVDRSILGPEVFLDTNVTGTFRLLDACLKLCRQKKNTGFRFLNVSTDEVYGSLGADGYFSEETPYRPSSPYSASKAAGDHLTYAYYRTYGLPAICTNSSNNYGPFQFPEKLIPLMILNILEGNELPVYGNGENVRDWIFVVDHCDALIRVLEQGEPGERYNIGGDSERRNIDVVRLLCELMDQELCRTGDSSSLKLIRFVRDRPGHDWRYSVDIRKIRRELEWRPNHIFEEALTMTVRWYLENLPWVESVRSGKYRDWINVNYGNRGFA